jgi:hypothetical protein
VERLKIAKETPALRHAKHEKKRASAPLLLKPSLGDPLLCVLSVAVLVLLAAAAGTRIVPADLGYSPSDLDLLAGGFLPLIVLKGPKARHRAVISPDLSAAAALSARRGFLDPDPDDFLGYVDTDVFDHLVKDVRALQFVFQQGVFLGVGPEAHRFPEGFHIVQVLLPVLIDFPQVLKTDVHVQPLRGNLGIFFVQVLLDMVQNPFPEFRNGEKNRILGVQALLIKESLLELVHDGSGVGSQAWLFTVGLQNIIQEFVRRFQDPFNQLSIPQDAVPLAVNQFPLHRKDIIIIQEVLPDIEIAFFHPFLGVLYGFVNPGVLDGLTVCHPQFTHHASDRVVGKEPHQGVV